MAQDFKTFLNGIEKRLNTSLPKLTKIVKREGLLFISSNFKKQGFEKKRGQVDKWKPKKKIKRKDKRKSQATLVDRGHLRRTWDTETTDTPEKVIFQSSHPAAAVHNEGLKSGRPPGFTMPKRQMIGESDALSANIKAKVYSEMKGVFLKK